MKYRTGKPHRIRMELVAQLGYLGGDPNTGYELVLPLNPDGQIDATTWSDEPRKCSVRHFRSGHPDEAGILARSPDGHWYIDYGTGHDSEHRQGIGPGDEWFSRGAFIAVNERDGKSRTYRVTSIDPMAAN